MLVVLLAALVGVSLGLLGGGGSILTTPILLFVAHLPGREAIASSLVVVGATAAFVALQHARTGQVHVRAALPFVGGSMLGAFAGGWVAGALPAEALLAGFTLVMVAAGLRMLGGPARPRPSRTPRPATLALTGLAVGVVTGAVGAGGGFIVVPALTLVGGLPMRAAIGTSLFVIALQSAAGLVGHLGHVQLDWPLVGLVTGSALGGSFIGARLAHRLSPDALRRGFALLVLAMSVYMGVGLLPPTMGASGWAATVTATLALAIAAGWRLSRSFPARSAESSNVQTDTPGVRALPDRS